jgi:hypothetical protein
VNIEVHHLKPEAQGGASDLDNAIPLCFECHAFVGHYNDDQPRGTKYKPDELRARREQIYEEFTRHLVPPIQFNVTQDLGDGSKRSLPNVGFKLLHLGDHLPVQVRVTVSVLSPPPREMIQSPYYSGEKPWRINPRYGISGHFDLPARAVDPDQKIELELQVVIIDQYEREHRLLPVGYVYMPENNGWYLEP